MLATDSRMAGADAFSRTMPFEKRKCEKKQHAAAARWSPSAGSARPAAADEHVEPVWRRLDDDLTTAQPFDVVGFGQVRYVPLPLAAALSTALATSSGARH